MLEDTLRDPDPGVVDEHVEGPERGDRSGNE